MILMMSKLYLMSKLYSYAVLTNVKFRKAVIAFLTCVLLLSLYSDWCPMKEVNLMCRCIHSGPEKGGDMRSDWMENGWFTNLSFRP